VGDRNTKRSLKKKLDEIGSVLKHSPPKSLKSLVQENALSGFKCKVLSLSSAAGVSARECELSREVPQMPA
jgi:hypothetical protein